jgi:ribose transport system substrate-binding protein
MTRKQIFLISLVIVLLISSFSVYGAPKQKVFGATMHNLNNPFFVALNEGLKQVVESKGDKLISFDPQQDLTRQISGIEDFVSRKVDAIFVAALDWKGIKPALETAKRAKIPVIVVDAPVYDVDLVATTVASDNWQAGVLCAEDMIKKTGGKANIVILPHPTAKSAIDRTEGFKSVIKKYPGCKIVAEQAANGQLDQAMLVMEDIIQAHPKIDVVMGLNDPTAMGAIAALESANRLKGVLVYGVDGSPDAKKMIKEGNKLTATASQFPSKIGSMGAEAAYKILAGEEVPKDIKVPVKLIDKSNIDQHVIDQFE